MLEPGARVRVPSKPSVGVAVCRFVGETKFAPGKWAGLELEEPVGKNSGSVKGVAYFTCKPNHGLFVPHDAVEVVQAAPKKQAAAAAPSTPSPAKGSEDPQLRIRLEQLQLALEEANLEKDELQLRVEEAELQTTELMQRLTKAEDLLRKQAQAAATAAATRTADASATSEQQAAVELEIAQQRLTDAQSREASHAATLKATQAELVAAKQELQRVQEEAAAAAAAVAGASSAAAHASSAQDEVAAATAKLQVRVEQLSQELARVRHELEEQAVSKEEAVLAADAARMEAEDAADDVKSLTTQLKTAHDTIAELKRMGGERARLVQEEAELASGELRQQLAEAQAAAEQATARAIAAEEACSAAREATKQAEASAAAQVSAARAQAAAALEDTRAAANASHLEARVLELEAQVAQASEAAEEALADHNDAMEMLTLDKELAEERAEMAAAQVTELQAELDALRASQSRQLDSIDVSGMTEEARIVYEHNGQLRTAVLKLKALLEAEQSKAAAAAKAHHDEVEIIPVLEETVDAQAAQISDLQEQLGAAHEAVELASQAEEMVETLSDQKMVLQDRVEELVIAVEQLEELQEVSREMEEQQREDERELRSALHARDVALLDKDGDIHNLRVALADREVVIDKFRKKSAFLIKQVTELRQREEDRAKEEAELRAQSDSFRDKAIQLQSSVVKTAASKMEKELHKLAANQAVQHLRMIQNLLPPAFFHSDLDTISGMLTVKRLVAKVSLITSQLEGRILSSVSGEPDVALFVHALDHSLASIRHDCERLLWVFDACPLDHFERLSRVQSVVGPLESAVDRVMSAVAMDSLGADFDLEPLARCRLAVAQLCADQSDVVDTVVPPSLALAHDVRQLKHWTSVINISLVQVNALTATSDSDALLAINSTKAFATDVLSHLRHEPATQYPLDQRAALQQVVSMLQRLQSALQESINETRLAADVSSGDGSCLSVFLSALSRECAAADLLDVDDESPDGGAWGSVAARLMDAQRGATALNDAVLTGSFTGVAVGAALGSGPAGRTTWSQRSEVVKEEIRAILGLEQQVREAKEREQGLQARLEEARAALIEEQRKQDVLVARVESRTEALRAARQKHREDEDKIARLSTYEAALKGAMADTERLEKQVRLLKMAAASGTAAPATTGVTAAAATPTTSNGPTAESGMVPLAVADAHAKQYRDALQHMLITNWSLKARLAGRGLHGLAPLPRVQRLSPPSSPSPPSSSTSLSSPAAVATTDSVRRIRLAAATPSMVDVTSDAGVTQWRASCAQLVKLVRSVPSRTRASGQDTDAMSATLAAASPRGALVSRVCVQSGSNDSDERMHRVLRIGASASMIRKVHGTVFS